MLFRKRILSFCYCCCSNFCKLTYEHDCKIDRLWLLLLLFFILLQFLRWLLNVSTCYFSQLDNCRNIKTASWSLSSSSTFYLLLRIYAFDPYITIIFQKLHWHEKSFPKKGHFSHIGNEIKICSQNKCHHHLSNICENFISYVSQ